MNKIEKKIQIFEFSSAFLHVMVPPPKDKISIICKIRQLYDNHNNKQQQ